MKIGFLIPAVFSVGNPYNGIREQALHQAKALEDLGHNIVFLNPWQKHELNEIDLVHFFQGGPGLHGLDTTIAKLRIPIVFSPIIDSMAPNWIYRVSERLGSLHAGLSSIQSYYSLQARASSAVIARSNYEKNKLMRGLGINESKIKIVLNGCNSQISSVCTNDIREKFSIKKEFLFHVSRYSNKTKNVLNLVKAVGPLGLDLLIAGTSEDTHYTQMIHQEASKYSNIKMIGQISDSDRDALYAACRVFCLPSTREGTGLVAVEAAAQGATIVTTSNGGPPDYFVNHAIYVKSHGVDEITSAIKSAWAKTPSDALREHVLNNLTWHRSSQSLARIYENVLQSNHVD